MPERLAKQPLEPVAHNGVAVRFTDGNAQSRITTVILRDIERNQPIAETPTPFVRQDSFELSIAHKPFAFWKRKPLHTVTSYQMLEKTQDDAPTCAPMGRTA